MDLLSGGDASVQGTNDDAQISKLSCSKAGYFKDDFIQYFVRRGSRRSPLINRGYYSRHAALRQLLHKFLQAASDAQQQAQVLVLGAGFDTAWFQLAKDRGSSAAAGGAGGGGGGGEAAAAAGGDGAACGAPYKCLEVDFKEVTKRKAAIITKEPALRALIEEAAAGRGPGPDGAAAPEAPEAPSSSSAQSASVSVRPDTGEVMSSCYCLLPVDLRDLAALEAAVQRAGFVRTAPTYILSECVLVYMEPQESAAVVGWAGRYFCNAAMAIYEQIKPDDAFGRQMVSNLEARGCPLKGLPATPSLAAHEGRFTDNGWASGCALDMDTLYQRMLDPQDKARIERLEIFDEFEEWHMIQEHYCIALGKNDTAGWLASLGFEAAPAAAAAAAGPADGAAPRRPLPIAD